MKSQLFGVLSLILLCVLYSSALSGNDFGVVGKNGDWKGPVPDEFRIKREAVFEFQKEPTLTRSGDNFAIRFTTKGFCDVTVAIEKNSEIVAGAPRIVRHLASGILGSNAPKPLRKNSKEQVLLWDGKDDQGKYIDDKDSLTVRVSLGLKPQFEKTLLWSPHKQKLDMPLIAPSPEGMLVFDGGGVDYLRLFDHAGSYLRTIYPFPADKVKEVKGIRWVKFPQGYRRPLKESGYQQTFLTSGINDSIHDRRGAMSGVAAKGIAVRGNRIALAYQDLNRLAMDGTSDGLPLKGPETGFGVKKSFNYQNRSKSGGHEGRHWVSPTSMAFSPDGKTLYLTGYTWHASRGKVGCLHAVMQLDYEKNEKPTVFVGSWDSQKFGRGADQLCVPTSVACDAKGYVYVTDYLNDRIQVFQADGRLLKSIPMKRPAKICIHPKTGFLYVFTWTPIGIDKRIMLARKQDPKPYGAYFSGEPFRYRDYGQGLTTFSAYPECRKLTFEKFPLGRWGKNGSANFGQSYHVELDSRAPGKDPAFWVMRRIVKRTHEEALGSGGNLSGNMKEGKWLNGMKIVRKKDGKWTPVFDFAEAAKRKIKRINALSHNIQELFVNPTNGKLYVGEGHSMIGKAYNKLLEVDPEDGNVRFIPLPFTTEEMDFDLDGHVYLRTTDVVARYDPRTWREIPWDYGEELEKVASSYDAPKANVLSGLCMPSSPTVCAHQSGLSISVRGHLVVACGNQVKGEGRKSSNNYDRKGQTIYRGSSYKPPIYPGRQRNLTSCCLHVWDRHGQLVQEDAVMGLPQLDGVHIDKDDNIYVMGTPTRMLGGKRYFNYMSETLMKFKPGKGKVIVAGRAPIKLAPESRPNRPMDVAGQWCEGAEWFYGGVGFAGFNTPHSNGGCACWYARFDLDYFARSFAPEPDQYSVAVLDSSGNLITRIGRYGNVDDGIPLVKAGGPNNPRKLGGDEVGLFHPCFVSSHTDRRLFISDLGNARIVSVKLGYHAEKTVALKGVSDRARGQ